VSDALTGVLGTILGFYFGRGSETAERGALRTASEKAETAKSQAERAENQAQQVRQELAVSQREQADGMASQADALLQAEETVVQYMPAEDRPKYNEALTRVSPVVAAAKRNRAPKEMKDARAAVLRDGPIALLVNKIGAAVGHRDRPAEPPSVGRRLQRAAGYPRQRRHHRDHPRHAGAAAVPRAGRPSDLLARRVQRLTARRRVA
jgi:hypothetical protein